MLMHTHSKNSERRYGLCSTGRALSGWQYAAITIEGIWVLGSIIRAQHPAQRSIHRGCSLWVRPEGVSRWNKSTSPQEHTHLQPAPHLRIVAVDLWRAVETHNKVAQTTYFENTNGERFGRLTRESKHLLSDMARCGCCEADIVAVPRPAGSGENRRNLQYYGCS